MNIQEYKQAQEEIEKLEKVREVKLKKNEEKRSKIMDRYYNMKQALERWQNKQDLRLKEDRNQIDQEISSREMPFFEKINEVKRFFGFIDIYLSSRNSEYEIYTWSNRDEQGNWLADKRKVYIEPIDTICDDEFKTIKAYIIENRKPKNKYSLVLYGYSIFQTNDNRFDLPWGHDYIDFYGSDWNTTIKKHLKNLPDQNQLIGYYEKNKSRILKDYLAAHQQLEQEFKEAITLFNQDKNWQLVYWENKRDYYKKNYHHGDESECYLEAVKKINELSNLPEDNQLTIEL